jgi:tyrosyl-tRNA synthetase
MTATMPETARVPSDAEIDHLTTRAVAQIVPREEFIALLKAGRPLRLKMGFDPSAPDLTLGHAVGLRKLRAFQELGHTVVVIVGDWTARIGDPSGQSATRPMLSPEQVAENAETYLRQFFKIVDRERTEIRPQSEWFDDFTLETIIRLAARFTVAQMLQREDFGARYREGQPLGVHELLYPIMQAYDSVAVEADVEFGGTDQTFNLLVGRELQKEMGQKPQCIFTVPLLVGADGQKMSKSVGNYIALEEAPDEIFGKIMALPDSVLTDYLTLVTDIPDEELESVAVHLRKGRINPMEVKMRLGREVVAYLYNEEAARAAEAEFIRIFRHRENPATVPELRLIGPQDLLDTLQAAGTVPSRSVGKRLIAQGAIDVNDQQVKENVQLSDGDVLRIGKRFFLRVRITDA